MVEQLVLRTLQTLDLSTHVLPVAAHRLGMAGRLPMVEVDPRTPLTGADGPVPLIDIFAGRSQLVAYFHM